jgi:nicotinate phosphoribosyltransferase
MTKDLKEHIEKNTDKYFSKTKKIVESVGDVNVVYAVFLRIKSIYACKVAITFLLNTAKANSLNLKVYENYKEGDIVEAKQPLFFIEGSFKDLVELETLILQLVGFPCITAINSYLMSLTLPKVDFISMVARHLANPQMVELCEYGVSVGSNKAKLENANGFIGSSVDDSAKLFGNKEGLGTMPHALIGYAGSTLNSAILYNNTIKPNKMTVLVDYFGKEITDSLEVCNYFYDMAKAGDLSLRLDTHGGRFLEGLDEAKSIEIIRKYEANAFDIYQDSESINHIVGKGVSVACVFALRESLDKAGFNKVKIVVSSGFDLIKCKIMATLNAPIDVVGTGSTMPKVFGTSFATADIISYAGKPSVKVGREFLIDAWERFKTKR